MNKDSTTMTDIDLRTERKGWAPGYYMCTCSQCQKRFSGDKRAWQCADCAYADWKPTHRHGKTGGLYALKKSLVIIESTFQPAVVYEAQDGTLWVRPHTEFYDGRFARIDE